MFFQNPVIEDDPSIAIIISDYKTVFELFHCLDFMLNYQFTPTLNFIFKL